MGLYSTLVRRRRWHQPPGIHGAGGSMLGDAGIATTTAIELHDMGNLGGNTSQASSQSVYNKFMKRNKKRVAAAESATATKRKGKGKHIKEYLPDRDATIGGLTLAFTAIRDIGDATNIGYMKGLAGLALLIIEVTEGVRTCKSEVQRLTKHIVELINALYNELSSRADLPSEETLYQIQSLQGKLQRIHTKLQKMREGNYWTRLLRQAEDNSEIIRFNEDIKHHLRVFGIQQNLSIHSNLARHDSAQTEHRNSLLQIIDNGHQTHMTAIRRTMSGEDIDTSTLGTTSDADGNEKARRFALTDGPITEEPDELGMDIDMTDMDEGTIHDGFDDQGFMHCLPPNPKMHFGHEEDIERISSLLVKHQHEEPPGSAYASHDVTPRPSTPVAPESQFQPQQVVPGFASSSTLASITGLPGLPSSSLHNPFATPPASPNAYSLSFSSSTSSPIKNYSFLPSSGSLSPSKPDSYLPSSSESSSPIKPYSLLPSSPSSSNQSFSYLPTTPSSSATQQFSSYLSSIPLSSRTPTSSYFPTPPHTPHTGNLSSFPPYISSSSISKTNPFAPLSPSLTKPGSATSPWSTNGLSPSSSLLSSLHPPPTPQRPPRPQGPARLAILGRPGIGKSSIAQRVVHHPDIAELYGDRRIFVQCDGASTADEVVVRIATTMGVEETVNGQDATGKLMTILSPTESTSSKSSKSPTPSTSSIASSSFSFSEVTDALTPLPPPPTLLVLDGLDAAWQPHVTRYALENLLNLLAALPQLALIVTLRGNERPLGVKWTRPFLPSVDPLKIEDAINIFTAIADVEDDMVKDIIECCDGNPTMITQTATNAQFESLSSLLSRLRHQKREREQRTALESQPREFAADMSAGSSLRSDIAGRL